MDDLHKYHVNYLNRIIFRYEFFIFASSLIFRFFILFISVLCVFSVPLKVRFYISQNSIFRSLLSKNAAPVLKIISDIFALILKFHVQLRSSSWEVIDNSFIVHSAFDSLCLTHKAFKEYTGFLFKGNMTLIFS